MTASRKTWLIRGGIAAAQAGSAWRQRVRRTQPEGGSMGDGMSPCITIRWRFRAGSGSGAADSSASV